MAGIGRRIGSLEEFIERRVEARLRERLEEELDSALERLEEELPKEEAVRVIKILARERKSTWAG